MGWTLACPFCRDPQKRESKSNEKCASLYPVEGTFLIFSLVKGDWMVGFREFSPVIIRCGSPPSSSSGTHLNTGSMWERRKKRRRTTNPSSLVRDRKGLQDLRLHQQSCIACLIELLWSVQSLRQMEGDELFDIAAIRRTDFLLGFCIWVLPWLVMR